MKKILAIMAAIFVFTGCSMQSPDAAKIKDLEYAIIGEEEIPEELWTQIEEKKQQEMQLCYSDETNLYVVRGYGTQQCSGYSISVNEVYLTEDAIVVCTSLMGPSAAEQVEQTQTYPYVVLKLELSDKNIIFE